MFAQAAQEADEATDPSLADNEVLDRFLIPFGRWIEEAVNWATLNLEWLLDGIAWPFSFLLTNLVENFLVELPWLVIVAAMFLIAWLVRNLTVATATAVGLTICGLLGPEYWEETARTIGLILVAVIICVIIGIPVGVLSGRIDSVWQAVRPTLDAMQVIHPFVYLLPFIYFWGVGSVSATMATMVFALPPLIRLTNLGIRQVPEDVVEAARAYGAPELRVLRDVQLPLARPAIMTGLNQTLLMAFSMLGIAAILGAGGLGRLLFRALGQQDAAVAAASGLAFFLLAVILDRISQTDADDGGNLLSRITTAWRARNNPEILLDDPGFNPASEEADEPAEADPALNGHSEGRLAGVGAAERSAMAMTVVGALVMMGSTLLTWGNNAGLLTSYSRRIDEDLAGQSFGGLAAEGGSWYGIAIVLMGIVVLAAVASVWTRWSGAGRWLAPDGALMASIGGLIAAFAYLVISPSNAAVDYSHGIGVYVAMAGGLLAVVGSVRWSSLAPYGPRRPLKEHAVLGPIVLAGVAVVIAVIASFSSWILDERADAVITPEIQARIDDVLARAEAGEIEPSVAGSEIQIIRASAEEAEAIVIDGFSNQGPGLGIWVLVVAAIGIAGAAMSSGLLGLDDRRQWLGGTVAMGCGLGLVMIVVGWAGSLARATDPNIFSGVGSLFAGIAGLLLLLSSRSIVGGFERSKVYADEIDLTTIDVPAETTTALPVPDPV